MFKLIAKLIALTAIGVGVKAKSKKIIKKSHSEQRKDHGYSLSDLEIKPVKINLDPLIRAEKELENLRSQIC